MLSSERTHDKHLQQKWSQQFLTVLRRKIHLLQTPVVCRHVVSIMHPAHQAELKCFAGAPRPSVGSWEGAVAAPSKAAPTENMEHTQVMAMVR